MSPTKGKSSAHYQREYRQRLREQGLVKKEVWIRPEHGKLLSAYEKKLRQLDVDNDEQGAPIMSKELQAWTTEGLFEALQNVDLFQSGNASLEMIDGVDQAIHVVMHEYGDLPLFMTVVGDQIVVESMLWSVTDVNDVAGFNEMVLRTHKLFPLSTISLDRVGRDGDYYHMFGALSATSILPNIVFEIEVLANNVIQATEAYSEFLNLPVAASE